MISRLIISVVFASLLIAGCESRANRTQRESGDVTFVLRPVEASLTESSERVADATEIRITHTLPAVDSFSGAQFVNRQKGWASTNKSLYTTSDEGKTWERLPFKAPDRAHISSFFFIDEFRGWMAVPKSIYTERYGLGNSSIIYNTKDGGRTWTVQLNFPDEVRIRQISFFDANRGIAIGSRMVDQPRHIGPAYSDILFLRTNNGGETWSEISEAVKSELARVKAQHGGAGQDVRWLSATEVFLLIRGGRVLHTIDSGATWKTLARFEDERPDGMVSSTGYYKIIFDPDRKLRVLGGAMGDEGFWGDLIVNSNNSWTSYELVRGPLQDVVFLSPNEVLAAGAWLPRADQEPTAKAAGVILRSLDCGKSWTPIYRSKREELFISLTRVGDKEFYAVSDAGTFLKFTVNN